MLPRRLIRNWSINEFGLVIDQFLSYPHRQSK
jgi:hypothetical protein